MGLFGGRTTAHRKLVDDSDWYEVAEINSYALFMGYLSMAVRGLGFLVLTWTTVVLLGGFVSMLQKKDFWCLTFITLVQTAGIFDVVMTEKLSYIGRSAMGLLVSVSSAVIGSFDSLAFARLLVAAALGIFQVLVLAILLCPLAAVFMFGLLISTGISLWRLISRDYGDNAATETNLKPAMVVLYSLALLQGVLFCYRFMLSFAGRRMVNFWESDVKFCQGCPLPRTLALEYLKETRLGCEKDPSFARGRNLVTYAVDMMGSNSNDDYISGTRVLDTLIRRQEHNRQDLSIWYNDELFKQHMLMKHQLIVSASSSHILQKLLQTLDSRSPYDRQTRGHAARIVAHFASYISLEQYPQGIQFISSLIDTFEEYLLHPFQRDWLLVKCRQDWSQEARHLPPSYRDESEEDNSRNLQDYKELVVHGLCILRKLATDENNCRVMSDTRGLLSKIMAPVTSDVLHHVSHDTCSDMVNGSLEVMHQFVAVPGETGAEFRRRISSSKEAISTMERILDCPECNAKLQIEAIGILTQLSIHFAHTSMGSQCRENFIKKLVTIFISYNYGRSVRRTAGEALAKLSIQGGSNATIVLQVNPDVGNLTKILLDDAEDPTCRKCTVEILEHLCIYYKQDDEYPSKLKEAMTDVMLKVLSKILPEVTRSGTGAREPGFSSPREDIEGQTGDVPQNNGHKCRAPTFEEYYEQLEKTDEQQEKDRVHAALFSFCVTVCETFISADQDLARQFDHEIDASGLLRKLKEMVVRNGEPRAHCLRMLKLNSRMVIAMMKHRGSYPRQGLENLMDALSSASDNMFLLDSSMVFASCDHDDAVVNKPVRTLASLVKEAKELVANYREEELEFMVPSTSVNGEP